MTHTKDRGVIWHLRWRRWWFILIRRLLDSQIFDIAATKDYVFIDIVGARDLLFWISLSPFCAKRGNLLERDSRVL